MKKIILEFEKEMDRKKFFKWLHLHLKYNMPCKVMVSMGEPHEKRKI